MKHRYLVPGILALTAIVATPTFATSASSISSFEGEEEPTVIYHVSSNSFSSDSYDNMVSASGGLKVTLRYRANNWWDGDRNTSNSDRQRAEVKGLGTHQANGQTFDYKSTWVTNSSFKQNGHFCHIFQLKALDGDNGAPLVTLSLDNGGNNGGMQYCSGTASGFTVARGFSYTPGSSRTMTLRIKTSTSASGEARLSINGDSLSGRTGVTMYRPSATSYRPKWGMYRGVGSNDSIGDDTLQHTSVSANRIN